MLAHALWWKCCSDAAADETAAALAGLVVCVVVVASWPQRGAQAPVATTALCTANSPDGPMPALPGAFAARGGGQRCTGPLLQCDPLQRRRGPTTGSLTCWALLISELIRSSVKNKKTTPITRGFPSFLLHPIPVRQTIFGLRPLRCGASQRRWPHQKSRNDEAFKG